VDGVVDGNNDVVGGIDVDGCTDGLGDNGVIVGDAVDGVVDGNNDVVGGIDVDGCTDWLGDTVVIGMEKIVVSLFSKLQHLPRAITSSPTVILYLSLESPSP